MPRRLHVFRLALPAFPFTLDLVSIGIAAFILTHEHFHEVPAEAGY